MGRSEDQALHNEIVFREANERIAERLDELASIEGGTPFLCECEDETCTTIVRLTPEQYQRVRAGAQQFVVASGHPTRGTPTDLSGAGWVCVAKGSMDERTRRVGENEALYREVNERVLELSDHFGIQQEPIQFLCECGDGGCTERISLARAEYERVRESGRRFAIRPGHELPEVETVVDRNERFAVVEKHEGEPAEVAEQSDPR